MYFTTLPKSTVFERETVTVTGSAFIDRIIFKIGGERSNPVNDLIEAKIFL